jgi:hypothetical protein
MKYRIGLWLFHALLFVAAMSQPALAADELHLLPENIVLSGPEGRCQLIVEQSHNGLFVGQIADGIEWSSSDEKVVRIENGVAIPVGNGSASVLARVGDHEATAQISVQRMDEPFTWSFRNHVESVMSKSGCNMGACHGAFAGKKGFKLSLRGFDAEADYDFLTRQARGRRVVLNDPGRSLLLTKPTGAIPHKGGVRFEVNSPEYRVIADWIAAGAPAPQPDDPQIKKLAILPAKVKLQAGAKQQFVVLATFSDGHVEEVTRWVKFASNNESVASIDNLGLATVTGSGESAISAWYLSQNVVAAVSVPYPGEHSADVFTAAPRHNFIDEHSLAKLESLNLPPSPPAADHEFVRRAYLDTIGVLPTPEETTAFVLDVSPGKRDRLVDALLARPEFVDYWAHRWADLLLASGERLRPKALETYYGWIRKNVEQNTPWDRFVYQLVTASGNTYENGAVNFYALHQDPTTVAETVSAAFLGMTINCAKCHNHPLEKWTNDQYFAFANHFSRVSSKGWGGNYQTGDGNRTVFAEQHGELIQPAKNKPQPPTPLDGEPMALDDPADRRIHLANWLVAPDNPYFTRAVVNRVWANYFGVGLVEAVDDLRLTNPASNEELFDAATQYLIDNKYDLKALMRAILTSATYQRSSLTLPSNVTDTRFYSHYYPKRMTAEVLIDGLSQVTQVPTQFKVRYGDADLKDQPLGKRAMELPDVDAASYFLKSFGRPARQITCECERTNTPTMVQVLHISNGDTLNNKLTKDDNRLSKHLSAGLTDDQIMDDLYLAALSRRPTDEERVQLNAAIAAAGPDGRRAVWEDVYWGVLSSKEFLFNH